jgi:putative aldouronate transport system permease protein
VLIKINKLQNEGKAYAVFQIINTLIMFFVILVTLVPYLNVLAKSLNDGIDSMRGGITIFPRAFSLENYKVLLNDASLYRAFFVTLAKVSCFVLGSLFVQFTAGYALSRKDLWGLKAVNLYFLIPTYIGAGVIPNYILYSNMGLLNSFWVYVFPGLWSFYNVIIIRSYMSSNISDSLIEAARIDGAGEWTTFFRIVIPLCKPIVATIILWTAVQSWNEWTSTLYYIQNPDLHTLQYKMMQTLKESERITALMQEALMRGEDVESIASKMKVTTESMQSAQIIVVTLPIIIVYPFLQKYFVKGVTLGAVKG